MDSEHDFHERLCEERIRDIGFHENELCTGRIDNTDGISPLQGLPAKVTRLFIWNRHGNFFQNFKIVGKRQ